MIHLDPKRSNINDGFSYAIFKYMSPEGNLEISMGGSFDGLPSTDKSTTRNETTQSQVRLSQLTIPMAGGHKVLHERHARASISHILSTPRHHTGRAETPPFELFELTRNLMK